MEKSNDGLIWYFAYLGNGGDGDGWLREYSNFTGVYGSGKLMLVLDETGVGYPCGKSVGVGSFLYPESGGGRCGVFMVVVVNVECNLFDGKKSDVLVQVGGCTCSEERMW